MRKGLAVSLTALLVGAVTVSAALAQDGRTVVLRGSGQVLLKDADGDFATLELNLHNSAWKYASQTDATAKCQDTGEEKTFTGALPVPEVAGATIAFLETITSANDGVHVIYEMRPSGPMILNGLQISLLLPTDRFGGQQLTVSGGEAAEQPIALPRTLNPAQWQMGTHKGNALQIGAEAATAVKVKIDKAYDLIIQDLRQWQRDEFEIRIPFIQADQGQMVGNNDGWDVEVILAPGPMTVTGP